MLKKYNLHPYILCAYFLILTLFKALPEIINFSEFYYPYSFPEIFIFTIIVSSIVLTIRYLANYFINEKGNAAIFTTIVLLPLLFYNYLRYELINLNCETIGRARVLIPIILFFYLTIFIIIKRARKPLLELNSYLNIVFIALCIYVTFQSVIKISSNLKNTNSLTDNYSYLNDDKIVITDTSKLPDIYYILLDSYTSNHSLKKYWNYDNSSFSNSLRELRFYVTDSSKCIFPYTIYSMASTFNMSNDSNIKKRGNEHAFKIINDNKVGRILKKMGYSIVNLSFFDFAGETKFYKFPEFNNDLFGHLERMLSGTILNIFIAYKNYDLYETNIKIFQTVEKEASKQRIKPKFIYAHIMSPHTPFLMNEKGEKLSRFETGNNKEAYLRQLKGVNVLVLETIKTILKTSNEPPIIIIQGDHGFREIKGENHDDEAYSVFSAYLLPIDEQRKISADMAPYNSFTRVLNLYESAKNK